MGGFNFGIDWGSLLLVQFSSSKGELDSFQEISNMYGMENVISLGIYKPELISTVK